MMFGVFEFNGIGIAVRNYYSALMSIEIEGQKLLTPESDSNIVSFRTDFLDLCVHELEERGCIVVTMVKEETVFRDPYNLLFRVKKGSIHK